MNLSNDTNIQHFAFASKPASTRLCVDMGIEGENHFGPWLLCRCVGWVYRCSRGCNRCMRLFNRLELGGFRVIS